jgi:uncharacterized protein (DUF983 family)
MPELVKCKVCGYIIEKGKLRDLCPACGVASKAFEPYVDSMDQRRSAKLGLHLHPICVHFPESFVIIILGLTIAVGYIAPFSTNMKPQVIGTLQILGLLLPFTVLISFLAGLYDGKLRFKRISTPLLKAKMMVGGLFFALSIVIGIVSQTMLEDNVGILVVFFCSLVCVGFSGFLGRAGASMLCAKIPK